MEVRVEACTAIGILRASLVLLVRSLSSGTEPVIFKELPDTGAVVLSFRAKRPVELIPTEARRWLFHESDHCV